MNPGDIAAANKRLGKTVTIYIESTGKFHRATREFMIDLIIETARNLNKPTILELSAMLGIGRNTMTRLLEVLNISNDYNRIRKSKSK